MVAEDPEVARLADRFRGNLGCLVRIGQTLDLLRAQELVELFGNEAGQRKVEVVELQVAEFQPQKFIVPLGILVRAVVHDAVGFGLRRGEALGHMHRDRLQPQLLGGLEPGVPDDHHQLLVHHDGLAEAELGNGRLHRIDGGGVVARVPGIGDQRLHRHVGDDHRTP